MEDLSLLSQMPDPIELAREPLPEACTNVEPVSHRVSCAPPFARPPPPGYQPTYNRPYGRVGSGGRQGYGACGGSGALQAYATSRSGHAPTRTMEHVPHLTAPAPMSVELMSARSGLRIGSGGTVGALPKHHSSSEMRGAPTRLHSSHVMESIDSTGSSGEDMLSTVKPVPDAMHAVPVRDDFVITMDLMETLQSIRMELKELQRAQRRANRWSLVITAATCVVAFPLTIFVARFFS